MWSVQENRLKILNINTSARTFPRPRKSVCKALNNASRRKVWGEVCRGTSYRPAANLSPDAPKIFPRVEKRVFRSANI